MRYENSKEITVDAPIRALVSPSFVSLILSGVGPDSPVAQTALQRAGIPADFASGTDKVTDRQFLKLLGALRRSTRDEFWGLGERPFKLGAFRAMCLLMLRERTVGEALRSGARFCGLLEPGLALRLVPTGQTTRIRILVDGPMTMRKRAIQGVVLYCVYNLASWLGGRRINLVSVNMAYDEAPYSAGFARSYRAPVTFGTRNTELEMAADDLSAPLVPDDRSLDKFLNVLPEILVLGYRDHESVSEKVMAILRRERSERVAVEDVAKRLAMSPATFRRRLKDEGIDGFQQLKDRARREEACVALAQSERPIEEIAIELGFAETSSFHRAFKRWTGRAPGEFRTHYKLDAA